MTERTLLDRMKARNKQGGAASQEKTVEGEIATPPPRTTTAADVLRQQQQLANTDTSVLFIEIGLIDVESQIRTEFNESYIADLTLDFIRTGTFQPRQPVTVYRRTNGRYLLDAGENRLRAVKYGDQNREALGVTDPTAFTTIRATVLGPEPDDTLIRLQSQARENLLRDDLNDVDLGNAVRAFMDATPDATQEDAAAWAGFVNLNSGRARVNYALKLLRCDSDLVQGVKQGTLATSRALKIQAERETEQRQAPSSELPATAEAEVGDAAVTSNADAMLAKAKAKKNKVTLSVDLENLRLAGEILRVVATQHGMDLGNREFNRKEITTLFSDPALKELLGRVKPQG